MVQGEDLAAAENQIERAIQLEPENQAYLLSLAQVQLTRGNPDAARRALEPLRLPYVEPQIRAQAQEMIKALGQSNPDSSQTSAPRAVPSH
jgi:thioredoxin-like negative regulator of GroEL